MQVQRIQPSVKGGTFHSVRQGKERPVIKSLIGFSSPAITRFGATGQYRLEYQEWLKEDVFLTPADYDLMMLVRTMNTLEKPVAPSMRKKRYRDPHDVFALWMTEKDSTLFNANPFLQPQPHWMRLIQKMVPTQKNPMAQFFPGVVNFNNELRQLLVVAGHIPPIAVKMAPKRYALNEDYQKMQKPDLDGVPFAQLSSEQQQVQIEKGRKEAKIRLADLRQVITAEWEHYQTSLGRTWSAKDRSVTFSANA